ncbi:MAG: ornithine carbamoyltransferase [Thermacetogeniaceae bacterium]|jgi:N-acetylornithine carbamoyltransferase|nr:ornithine carbamoyltransferase [Thermoanaerobacterales bacterium]
MQTRSLRGRDFINTLEFTKDELETFLETAATLKQDVAMGREHPLLKNKTAFLIFYCRSTRTRNSFETGMTQLGGHGNYLDVDKIYTPAVEGEEKAYVTERVADTARVLSRFGHGIVIRIYGDAVRWVYGAGNKYIREFAEWADIPVINAEDDVYHPTQSLADMLTIKEKLGDPRGKKLVVSWAYSPSVKKPVAVPQCLMATASKFGMNITFARPEGFELDPMIIDAVKENVKQYGGSFEETDCMKDAFKDADIVYPKSWASMKYFPPATEAFDEQKQRELFDKHKDWICDEEMLKRAKHDVLYMHCLPCDRGYEVTDAVADGPNSVIFDEAENRLHIQKAILSLLLK